MAKYERKFWAVYIMDDFVETDRCRYDIPREVMADIIDEVKGIGDQRTFARDPRLKSLVTAPGCFRLRVNSPTLKHWRGLVLVFRADPDHRAIVLAGIFPRDHRTYEGILSERLEAMNGR